MNGKGNLIRNTVEKLSVFRFKVPGFASSLPSSSHRTVRYQSIRSPATPDGIFHWIARLVPGNPVIKLFGVAELLLSRHQSVWIPAYGENDGRGRAIFPLATRMRENCHRNSEHIQE
ncbi:hypothetical protein [Candidatus Spongiihabitans sp.]|uniref:hypothetical protein n=1 Tax=Candidatus Spongiihabitans sp. TaxID=3101308 RepID=UPI003C7A5503